MKNWLLLILLTQPLIATALETSHKLTAEQWAVPRSVETVIAMPALSRAMQEFQATPGGRLVIRYPGGDEGSLWVEELRSWLVSLGLSSSQLELIPGSTNHEVISLEVVAAPDAISADPLQSVEVNESPEFPEVSEENQ